MRYLLFLISIAIVTSRPAWAFSNPDVSADSSKTYPWVRIEKDSWLLGSPAKGGFPKKKVFKGDIIKATGEKDSWWKVVHPNEPDIDLWVEKTSTSALSDNFTASLNNVAGDVARIEELAMMFKNKSIPGDSLVAKSASLTPAEMIALMQLAEMKKQTKAIKETEMNTRVVKIIIVVSIVLNFVAAIAGLSG